MLTAGDEINMGRLRPTDMKNNREVRMPGPAPPAVEAEYSTRLGVWHSAFSEFKKTHCRENGDQVRSNLSAAQQLGLKSLGKRVAKLEIIVLQADKGRKFVVVDEPTYVSMAMDHVSKDVETSPAEVRTSQNILSCTAKALGNIMGVGRAQPGGSYGRCMDNLGGGAEDVPNLKILPKVHKALGPQGHPQSRPVVTAASGLSSRAGDMIADFLEPMVNMVRPRLEERSTEEVLSQLQEAETRMRDDGVVDSMVGSLDVAALYPSLDHEGAAEEVAKMIMKSQVSLAGIDWRAAQTFLASNLSEDQVKAEGLKSLVPNRLKARGKRPGNTTNELKVKYCAPCDDPGEAREKLSSIQLSKEEKKASLSKWAPTDVASLSNKDKRKIIAKVIKVSIKTVFLHHMYQFRGQTYRQSSGGPIGLRLTSVVARIVMDSWMTSFLKMLVDEKIDVYAAVKYVDDVNVVISMLRLGTRWLDTGLETRPEWEEEDRLEGVSREKMTMDCIQGMAGSVFPWLDFTGRPPRRPPVWDGPCPGPPGLGQAPQGQQGWPGQRPASLDVL